MRRQAVLNWTNKELVFVGCCMLSAAFVRFLPGYKTETNTCPLVRGQHSCLSGGRSATPPTPPTCTGRHWPKTCGPDMPGPMNDTCGTFLPSKITNSFRVEFVLSSFVQCMPYFHLTTLFQNVRKQAIISSVPPVCMVAFIQRFFVFFLC